MSKVISQNTEFASDKILFISGLFLFLAGLIFIYSTTGVIAEDRFGDSLFFLKRQLLAGFLGCLAFLLVQKIHPKYLYKNSSWALLISLILVLCTFIPGVGTSSGGASRWISLMGFNFQPAELLKFTWIIFLASYFERHKEEVCDWKCGILKPFLILGPLSIILLMQPDFGSTAILGILTLMLALVAGVKLRYMLVGVAIVSVLASILIVVSPYRMARVFAFLDPFADSSGKGYQLIQSLIAVGSGKITGVGLGASQQKLFFLPAAHTDFIFAVISEELGFLGGVSIIFAYLLIFWRGLALASRNANSTFLYILISGLTFMLVVPGLLNIGVVLGLLPTKGLVLPLVGYGGSSLIMSLLVLGFLVKLSRDY